MIAKLASYSSQNTKLVRDCMHLQKPGTILQELKSK